MVGNRACTHVSVEHDLLDEIFADLPPIFLVISSDDIGYKSVVGGPGQCVLVAPSPKKPQKHVWPARIPKASIGCGSLAWFSRQSAARDPRWIRVNTGKTHPSEHVQSIRHMQG